MILLVQHQKIGRLEGGGGRTHRAFHRTGKTQTKNALPNYIQPALASLFETHLPTLPHQNPGFYNFGERRFIADCLLLIARCLQIITYRSYLSVY
jgi:hypothetical protein